MTKHWADKPLLRDFFWFLVLPHQFKQYAAATKKKVDDLTAALEEAMTGIEWYRAEHPESDSGADDEFMERAKAALKQEVSYE